MPPRSNSLDSFDFAMRHQARPTMFYILLVINMKVIINGNLLVSSAKYNTISYFILACVGYTRLCIHVLVLLGNVGSAICNTKNTCYTHALDSESCSYL